MANLALKSDYFAVEVTGEVKKYWMKFLCEAYYRYETTNSKPGYWMIFTISMQNENRRCYKKTQSFFVPRQELNISFLHLFIELERAWWNYMKRSQKPSFVRVKDKLFREFAKRQIYDVKFKKKRVKMKVKYCGNYDIVYHRKGNYIYGEISREKVKLNFKISDFSLEKN